LIFLKRELGFKRVSQNDVIRYKLWREFGQVSPYEPNKVISLKAAFNLEEGVLYEIEHIIPKSRIFDDSYSNKTLCPRALNSGINGKNQDTAYDFMKRQGEDNFLQYVEFLKIQLNRKDGISKSKYNKLLMSGDKIPEDFIERQMQETRYISREVHSLLQKVCRNVYSTTGAVTSKLRKLWGWDEILMNLHIDEYRAQEQTEIIEINRCGQISHKERIKDWTKRLDHRHHAIDALCIACTTQSMIQRINTLNAEYTRKETDNNVNKYNDKLSSLERYLIQNKPFKTHQVEDATSKIIVSFKKGKRVGALSSNKVNGKIVKTLIPRGELHKSHFYGQIKQYEKAELSPSFDRFDDIADESVKKKLFLYLSKFTVDRVKLSPEEQFINQRKIGFSKRELTKFLSEGGFNKVTLYKSKFVFHYKLDSSFKLEHVESIVDNKVKEIIRNRLILSNNNSTDAFGDLDKSPIYYDDKRNIQIRGVRRVIRSIDLNPLYDKSNIFVSTNNNHHISIYKDKNGDLKENIVTFWEAFERKKMGLPVVVKSPSDLWTHIIDSDIETNSIIENLPQDGWEYVTSMQQNEMFVFGICLDDLKKYIEDSNYQLISKHLYRVQKIAKNDYCFRLHTETKIDDKNGALSIKLGNLIRIRSLSSMSGIKVVVNKLGRIRLDADYDKENVIFWQSCLFELKK